MSRTTGAKNKTPRELRMEAKYLMEKAKRIEESEEVKKLRQK